MQGSGSYAAGSGQRGAPAPSSRLPGRGLMIGAGLVLAVAWVGAAAHVAQRWEGSAPYRARVAEERAARRAAEQAERDRQEALRQLGRDLAAADAADVEPQAAVGADGGGAPLDTLAAPSSSATGRTRAPVLEQPRWLERPQVDVPSSLVPSGGADVRFACTLTVGGRLGRCSGQGPSVLVSLIEPRLAEARLTPFKVDGRPTASQISFSYSFTPARRQPVSPPRPEQERWSTPPVAVTAPQQGASDGVPEEAGPAADAAAPSSPP